MTLLEVSTGLNPTLPVRKKTVTQLPRDPSPYKYPLRRDDDPSEVTSTVGPETVTVSVVGPVPSCVVVDAVHKVSFLTKIKRFE